MHPTQRHGLYQPEVPFTVQGTEELARWRRRQLRSIAVVWALPVVGVVLTVMLFGMGLGFLSPIPILVGGLAGLAAPGLTVVFAARYLKARRADEDLPQLPKARVQAGQRELPAATSPSGER